MFLKKCVLCFFLIFVLSLASVSSFSAEKGFDSVPIQLSFFNPIQLMPEDFDVYGLRLTFPYGVNNSVYGLDMGVWNTLSGDLNGIGFAALLSNCKGSVYGVNTGGVLSYIKGDGVGLPLAGIINDIDGTARGLQASIAYNEAKKVEGVQLGIVNYCEDMDGVQLGIVNICKDQWIPFTIFLNVWF